jgi:hypothetical protein
VDFCNRFFLEGSSLVVPPMDSVLRRPNVTTTERDRCPVLCPGFVRVWQKSDIPAERRSSRFETTEPELFDNASFEAGKSRALLNSANRLRFHVSGAQHDSVSNAFACQRADVAAQQFFGWSTIAW